jgi:hypothetical protein
MKTMRTTRSVRLFWSLCLLSGAALATPPKKAIGEAKEDDPVVCPALPASPLSVGDVALFRALSWAFEPAPIEVRAQAIEDLGFLGDARALNALAQLCLDPNPALARAAIRAIAAIRHPRAEEILSNVIRHPNVPEPTKQRALELLPYQNTWSSLRFIRLTAAQTTATTSVVLLARRMSAELPQRPLPELKAPAQASGEQAPMTPLPLPPLPPPSAEPRRQGESK